MQHMATWPLHMHTAYGVILSSATKASLQQYLVLANDALIALPWPALPT